MPDPKPDPTTTVIEAQITDALAELREARVHFDHSPNTVSEYMVGQAEMRLDGLLDQRQRLGVAEQLVKG